MSSIRPFEGIEPTVGHDVYIDPQATVIGQVCLGDQVSVWPQAVLRGDVNTITIGKRTNIQDGAIIHNTHAGEFFGDGHPIIVGDDVTIGHQAMLHGCIIHNRVLVGMQAVLLDGVVVPNEVMIGAGSLVPPGKVLESGFLYVGSPAKKVRQLTDKEQAYFTYSANFYATLAARHQAS